MEDVEVVNVRVNPVHPIQNPSSIRMRQEGFLHRQTVVRYPEKGKAATAEKKDAAR